MKILFASLHHRKSLLFEEGIKLLLDEGYQVIIQNTGLNRGFGEFDLKHPNLTFLPIDAQISYDDGLVRFKSILSNYDWDIVHFIDNDCFITDLKYLKQRIEEFANSPYEFCSYFENGSDQDKYLVDGIEIAEVKDQAFVKVEEYPRFKPVPHWENAMMMFKRKAWDMLDEEALSNGRLCIDRMVHRKIRMSVTRRESILPYSHYGPGWFHVGALMSYYYRIEDLNMVGLNKDSEVDQFRIGYFIAQQRKYQDAAGMGTKVYPPYIEANLRIISEMMGGEEKCYSVWKKHYEKSLR